MLFPDLFLHFLSGFSFLVQFCFVSLHDSSFQLLFPFHLLHCLETFFFLIMISSFHGGLDYVSSSRRKSLMQSPICPLGTSALHPNHLYPQMNARSGGSKARLITWEQIPLTISRGNWTLTFSRKYFHFLCANISYTGLVPDNLASRRVLSMIVTVASSFDESSTFEGL